MITYYVLWHKRLGHISYERMKGVEKTLKNDFKNREKCAKEKIIKTKRTGSIRNQRELDHFHYNWAIPYSYFKWSTIFYLFHRRILDMCLFI